MFSAQPGHPSLRQLFLHRATADLFPPLSACTLLEELDICCTMDVDSWDDTAAALAGPLAAMRCLRRLKVLCEMASDDTEVVWALAPSVRDINLGEMYAPRLASSSLTSLECNVGDRQ